MRSPKQEWRITWNRPNNVRKIVKTRQSEAGARRLFDRRAAECADSESGGPRE